MCQRVGLRPLICPVPASNICVVPRSPKADFGVGMKEA